MTIVVINIPYGQWVMFKKNILLCGLQSTSRRPSIIRNTVHLENIYMVISRMSTRKKDVYDNNLTSYSYPVRPIIFCQKIARVSLKSIPDINSPRHPVALRPSVSFSCGAFAWIMCLGALGAGNSWGVWLVGGWRVALKSGWSYSLNDGWISWFFMMAIPSGWIVVINMVMVFVYGDFAILSNGLGMVEKEFKYDVIRA